MKGAPESPPNNPISPDGRPHDASLPAAPFPDAGWKTRHRRTGPRTPGPAAGPRRVFYRKMHTIEFVSTNRLIAGIFRKKHRRGRPYPAPSRPNPPAAGNGHDLSCTRGGPLMGSSIHRRKLDGRRNSGPRRVRPKSRPLPAGPRTRRRKLMAGSGFAGRDRWRTPTAARNGCNSSCARRRPETDGEAGPEPTGRRGPARNGCNSSCARRRPETDGEAGPEPTGRRGPARDGCNSSCARRRPETDGEAGPEPTGRRGPARNGCNSSCARRRLPERVARDASDSPVELMVSPVETDG